MREIKFRFWIERVKQMASWEESLKNQLYILDKNSKSIPMQFTGLKDKNGKEIYEGDIIRDGKDNSIGVVIYTTPMFSVKEKGKLDSDDFWNLGAGKVYPENWLLTDTEVIGNIHENPELLKE